MMETFIFRRPILRYLSLGWMAACLYLPLSASPLVNGSFESGLDGWTVAGNVSVQNAPPYAPTDGTKLAAFNAVDSTPNGSIGQIVEMPGLDWHRLSFDAGNLTFNNHEQKIRVQVHQLFYGGPPQLLLIDEITIPGPAGGGTRWIHKDYTVTSQTHRMLVTFTDISSSTTASDLVLDNVRMAPSYYFSVNSSFDSPVGSGVPMTVTPTSLENLSGGTTYFNRTYFEGDAVTVTAPASANGNAFLEWTLNGLHRSSNPVTLLNVNTNYMILKAVYGSPITVYPDEPFDARGFAGTGPFGPLYKSYSFTNQGSAQADWTASFQVTGGGSDGKWLSVWPPSGTLATSQSVPLRTMINGRALDLPPGKHTGKLVISSTAGNREVPISLTVMDPGNLVANGSFESGFDGWTVTGNSSLQNAVPYAATDGAKLVAFNAVNSTPNGVISQTVPTEAGVLYSLYFDVGVLSYTPAQLHSKVEVTNAEDPSNPLIISQINNVDGAGDGTCHWENYSLTFTATGNSTKITIRDLSPTTVAVDLLLDRVRLLINDNHAFGITVTTLADENNPALGQGSGDSLREALAAAASRPGTNAITFAPGLNGGTITLGSGRLLMNSNVAIDALALADGITVSGANASRVFENTGTSAIRHLKIVNGYDDAGGGGGILNQLPANLMLIDSELRNNASNGPGGGVLNFDAMEVWKCTFASNQSAGPGGGLHTWGNGHVVESTFSDNHSAAGGGGVSCQGAFGGGWLTLDRTTVSNNTAAGNGGGYAGIGGYKQMGRLNAINSTFFENTSAGNGGAIYGYTIAELMSCTVSANRCTGPDGDGGGIFGDGLSLANTIVAGNTAANHPDVFSYFFYSAGVNFIGGDPKLRAPDSNGGPTLTMKPLSNSPVLDAGGTPAGLPATDQRGEARLSGGALDIGAVEVREIVVNTLADENNGLNTGGISLREAIGQPYEPHLPELIRFDPSLSGGTILLNGTSFFILGYLWAPLEIDARNLPGGLTVSGNHLSNVFDFYFSNGSLSGLTITGSAGNAVSAGYSNVALTDCVIRDNATAFNGAGLGVYDSLAGGVSVTRCTFANNTAAGSGGAIYNEALVWVRDCTFYGNHSGASGGAIKTGIYRTGMVIWNSTFSGNSSVGSGGAIEAGSLKLIHSTAVGNSSSGGSGGGLSSTSTTGNPEIGLTITNSIIAGNNATANPNISGVVDAYQGANFTSGNPMLAPFDYYGGATKTMPPLPGSPVIDAAVVFPDVFPYQQADIGHDQRGAARPNGPLPDIGATEAFAFSSLALVDSDGDGIDDRLESSCHLTVGINDSAADSDGDGSTDAMEMANMTDPLDANSVLKITSFVPAPGFDPVTNPVFDVTFICFPGLSYSLECDQSVDFSSPASRRYACGVAGGFTKTTRITMAPGRDFVRVMRNP